MNNRMKRIFLILSFVICHHVFGLAQTNAKEVLDKCAATLSVKDGVRASFTIESAQQNLSGEIAVKGNKFYATTPLATMWFDGKTQWTYLKKNDEVSVTNPTESQLQAINPYNFIHMYKKGYKYTMNASANAYTVHLTAEKTQQKVAEMFITVDKKSYAPTQVKMLTNNKWTTFHIRDLKPAKLQDSQFRFNAKDFPSAEVIDLR